MANTQRVGILTGGGDCPGLNAAIRAVVRSLRNKSIEVLGFKFGWKGILERNYEPLDLNAISCVLPLGGTLLGTSRTNPLEKKSWPRLIQKNLEDLKVDACIVVGGDGTLRGTLELSQTIPFKFVAIPKTIDNDIEATDFSFGFDTAVMIATEAIDRLHTTAESHQRVMVLEVMGRDTGWIATFAGIAGGADYILIPEIRVSIQDVVRSLKKRHDRGKTFSIVVVAEGAKLDVIVPAGGHIGKSVASEIEKHTGYETRVTILGHVQRGGTPTAHDRILATRYGSYAADLVQQEKFGDIVVFQNQKITSVPLKSAVGKMKRCDLDLYQLAKRFFG